MKEALASIGVTSEMISSLVITIVLSVIAIVAGRHIQMVPSGLQNVVELAIEKLYSFFESIMGKWMCRRYFPLVATLFIYILFCNYTGILPFAGDVYGLQGDGILTANALLMPVLTAADCMPIFFYERECGVFGVVHSGWKGTGIVSEAINMIKKIYKGNPRRISVALGPHIRNCCYIVDEERASYFKKNFCEDCVSEYDGTKRYRLSLEKANLFLLEKAGILDENVVVCDDCTKCDDRFGSFRRETGGDIKKTFTVQAAFCGRIG